MGRHAGLARTQGHGRALSACGQGWTGLGICQTYDFIARDLIAQGRAVEVPTQARGRSRPFSVIYAPHRRLSSASRALIDSLAEVKACFRNGIDPAWWTFQP